MKENKGTDDHDKEKSKELSDTATSLYNWLVLGLLLLIADALLIDVNRNKILNRK